MAYKNFRIVCAIRVVLLGATVALFFYLLRQTTLYATLVIVGALIIYEIYALIHYVEKTNRDLTRFLEAVKHTDFSQTFSGSGLGTSFDDLKAAFNQVISDFQRTRTEKEEHYRYLQTLMQHVGIGLISYEQNGDVELVNTAAKRLLKVGIDGHDSALRNIQSLEAFSKPLVEALRRLRSGEKALVKIEDKDELLNLAIFATEFRMRDKKFTLVSIQNIQPELEEKEMEAWQNLIRVLTHEIMNSVTPIVSLTSTINDLLESGEGEAVPARAARPGSESMRDIRGAVQTIQKRSKGLLHFVDAYRNLTRIPKPSFQIFPVAELFNRVQQLMQARLTEKGIALDISVDPPRLEVTADPELVEQVMINLVVNAIQAMQSQAGATLRMRAQLERGRVAIHVTDNGPGIIPEALGKIFIPFFTTKPEGSGIGLSLSRQIMRLHRGTISARSTPHVETTFTLKF